MLKRNPYLADLLIRSVELVIIGCMSLILRALVDGLPSAVQWTVFVIFILLVAILIKPADRALHGWLINKGWLENGKSSERIQ